MTKFLGSLLYTAAAVFSLGGFATPVLAAEVPLADFRCEGLATSQQIDTAHPRFSWRLDGTARALRQAAYELRVYEGDGPAPADATAAVDSGRIESDESQWREIPNFTAQPRRVYSWQVRVWDNQGGASAWSAPSIFGTGLIGSKWVADWIGDGRNVALNQTMPARYLRGTFNVAKKPVRARLYFSALGLAAPQINGRAVTQDLFMPGWPDYRQRVYYTAYDVTDLVNAGANAWGAVLGDGWYSGTILPNHQYGTEPMFSAFLDLTDETGKVTTIRTGKNWKWADGPILLNSIYKGEVYDARKERNDWCTAASTDWEWRDVSVRSVARVYQSYTARVSPPVRRHQVMTPVSRKEVRPGVFVYDLGQNIVGWARLKVHAAAGQDVMIRFAEMLDPSGQVYTANLRSATGTAHYIARGGADETWEPSFTYFGFRYIELSGVEHPADDAIAGVVVYTDAAQTGTFTCSDTWLNQMYENTLWGQRGNFLEIPTDCPQRDERLGWTGDAQIFSNTALYNMNVGTFYRQWLSSLRDGYRDGPDGGFPDTAPSTGFTFGSAGWGDAGVIIPYMVWLHTGDRRVLEESVPSIQHFMETMSAQSPDGIRHARPSYGDWLAPGFAPGKAPPDYDLIATAYMAHSADLAARIAAALGRKDLEATNRALQARATQAFQKNYIDADGRVASDVQTSYLLALGYDLTPASLREAMVRRLVGKLADADNHLSTGFLGTPLLTPVLTANGRADLAYTVLEQKTYPGWLFSVKNGATTVWERWDSWTPEGGFNKDGMNSFNHYAYGSVVEWFYNTIAGLAPLPESPGWKRFRIAPIPGGGLTSAAATVQTPQGVAGSRWEIAGGRMHLTVRIPTNTDAEISLPAADFKDVHLDGKPLASGSFANGQPMVLPSGEYTFDLPAPKI